MNEASTKVRGTAAGSRTRSIAFIGLSIALLSVSAWVSIPLGPIPFTLQTFVVVFAFLVLTPRECLAVLAGYLVLGAIGLPLFASMRGGIGVLAGPTGGFLWGFLLGAGVAILVRLALRALVARSSSDAQSGSNWMRDRAIDLISGFLLLAVSYVCGWAQFMTVAGVSPAAAFATAVAPFIIIDVIKLVAAVLCARAVNRALPKR